MKTKYFMFTMSKHVRFLSKKNPFKWSAIALTVLLAFYIHFKTVVCKFVILFTSWYIVQSSDTNQQREIDYCMRQFSGILQIVFSIWFRFKTFESGVLFLINSKTSIK